MNQIQLLENVIAGLRAALATAGGQGAELATELAQQSERSAALGAEVRTLSAACNQFETKLSVLERLSSTQKATIAALELENANLHASTSALSVTNQERSQKLLAAEAKQAEANAHIEVLQKRLSQNDEEKTALTTALETARSDLQKVKGELTVSGTQASLLNEKVMQLTKTVETLRSELGSKDADLAMAIRRKDEELLEAERRNKKLQADLKTAQETIRDLILRKDEIKQLQKELKEARERLATLPVLPGITSAPDPTPPAVTPKIPPEEAHKPLNPDAPEVPDCTFEKKIGSGGQAVLWKGTYKGSAVVFKIPMTADAGKDWTNEFEVLKCEPTFCNDFLHHTGMLAFRLERSTIIQTLCLWLQQMWAGLLCSTPPKATFLAASSEMARSLLDRRARSFKALPPALNSCMSEGTFTEISRAATSSCEPVSLHVQSEFQSESDS